MSLFIRILDKNSRILYTKCSSTSSNFKLSQNFVPACLYSQQTEINEVQDDDEFRVLNLRQAKRQVTERRKIKKPDVLPPRFHQMATDQDWGAVWPGPRSFHPATVPMPVRQGWTPKNVAPPSKYANAELMKIPNFLHLTPPVIKRQCEALKKFCTPFPKELESPESQEQHLPLRVMTSDYVQALPTVRNPLSRIVTVKIKLDNFKLDQHAKDKFLRLVGERYNSENDELTLVTDRCPIKKQNYDYTMYLLTALYHESRITEDWESSKVLVDMEYYDWHHHKSKESSTNILNWSPKGIKTQNQNQPSQGYIESVETMMNDGENEYNLEKYKEQVVNLLGLAPMKK